MMPGTTAGRTAGVGALAVAVFLLFAMPRLNMRVAGIPIYFIDLAVFMAVLYGLTAALRESARELTPRYPFGGMMLLLAGFAVIGEIVSLLYGARALEPIYLTMRTVLAFSLFFAVPYLVRTQEDIRLVAQAATLGLLITGTLMVLVSLPMTRGFVINNIFSIPQLEPATERLTERYLFVRDPETGTRGRSLVGVSIVSATFVNLAWPLAALLLVGRFRLGPVWRALALAAVFLAPLAVLMSYSRGPIAGTVLVLLAALLLGVGRLKRALIVPVVATVGFVGFVGVGSQLLMMDRLVTRVSVMVDDPTRDYGDAARFLAYVQPFEHVFENPQFLVLGQGAALSRTGEHAMRGQADHALFAAAYYTRGMAAALIYMFLIVAGLYYANRHRGRRGWDPGGLYAKAMFLSLLAIIPWALFGHMITTDVRGMLMFSLILGLLASLRNFPIATRDDLPDDRPAAYSRPAAV